MSKVLTYVWPFLAFLNSFHFALTAAAFSILNLDDRVVIKSAQQFPISATGRLSNGCTASVLSKNILVTASHCIKSETISLTFSPGFVEGRASLGQFKVLNHFLPLQRSQTEVPQTSYWAQAIKDLGEEEALNFYYRHFDIALLEVEDIPLSYTGFYYLPKADLTLQDILENLKKPLLVFGYGATIYEPSQNLRLRGQNCLPMGLRSSPYPITQDNIRLLVDCDFLGGDSGGPILVGENDQYDLLIAVTSSGPDYGRRLIDRKAKVSEYDENLNVVYPAMTQTLKQIISSLPPKLKSQLRYKDF